VRTIGWMAALLSTGLLACATEGGGAAARRGVTSTPSGSYLAGSEWALLDLGGTTITEGRPTLAFAEPGRLSGNGSCNRFSGPVDIGEGTVKIGALASTKMACAEPELNTQEVAYLAALQNAERLVMDGPVLIVYTRSLEKPLRFSRLR
jgi:heat shock protein HslJ